MYKLIYLTVWSTVFALISYLNGTIQICCCAYAFRADNSISGLLHAIFPYLAESIIITTILTLIIYLIYKKVKQ